MGPASTSKIQVVHKNDPTSMPRAQGNLKQGSGGGRGGRLFGRMHGASIWRGTLLFGRASKSNVRGDSNVHGAFEHRI